MLINCGFLSSPSKGVPEKHFAFDLQLYDEIIPEVRFCDHRIFSQ